MPLYIAKRRILRSAPIGATGPTYFSLAGITNPTEIAAVNTLKATLQGGTNIYARLDHIYPFSPTSLAAASYCLKTLTQLTFVASPTSGSTGVAFNGSTQYGYIGTEFIDSLPNFGGATHSVGIYATAIGTLTGSQMIFGATGFDNGDNVSNVYLRQNSTSIASNIIGAAGISFVGTIVPAFYFATRASSTSLILYKNGVSASTSSIDVSSFGLPLGTNMGIAALKGSSVTSFMPCTIGFFVIGAGLDATDQLTLYNAIQAYQTSLSRNV